MKGIVFTEFLEMVEERMGLEAVDRIITMAELPHDGSYTAVGTYDYKEMVRLSQAVSKESGEEVSKIFRDFGEYLFPRFAKIYPSFFEGISDSLEFLKGIEVVIHSEVKKLYPEAELPKFFIHECSANELVLDYHSPRHFADLAEGLIYGCIAWFENEVYVCREDLQQEGDCQCVRFYLWQQQDE